MSTIITKRQFPNYHKYEICLLYTSDAADE